MATSKLPRGISLYRDRYRVRVTYNGRQYGYGMYDTLTAARAALRRAQADITNGTFLPPTLKRTMLKEQQAEREARALTVQQWASQWLTSLEEAGRSPSTVVSYRSTLNAHVLPQWGTRPLNTLTQEDMDTLVKNAARERTMKGRKTGGKGAAWNVARTVRAMLKSAVEHGAGNLTAMPFRITVPKAGKRRDMIVTPTEIKKLADLVPPNMRVPVLLSAWCALRLGEVLGLQRRDFRNLDTPDAATLTIERQWLSKADGSPLYQPPKDNSVRVVSIPPALVPLIVEHLERFTPPSDTSPFLAGMDVTRPLSESAFDRQWRKARDQVKPGLHFHDLRHAALTYYAQQNATGQEIMARGGHKSMEVSMRYQHATRQRDQHNTHLLNNLIEL